MNAYHAIGSVLCLLVGAACGSPAEPAEPTDPATATATDPATAPTGEGAPTAQSQPDEESDELDMVSFKPRYALYVLYGTAYGTDAPPLPPQKAQSEAMHAEAVTLFDDERYLEAAARFLEAADTLNTADVPYYAETFDTNRGLMCGNATWAFMSVDSPERAAAAAAERETSDPACAAGIRDALSILED